LLVSISPVPESGLAHEVEPNLLKDSRCVYLTVGTEEDGGSKDSLEGSDEPSVLCSALTDAEGLQHRSSRGEGDCSGLLSRGQGGEENRISLPGCDCQNLLSDINLS
jgi:hypothetical protein